MMARRFASFAVMLVAVWLAGFAWFVLAATRQAPLPPQADGIVALTGGADRVATAFRLLQQGKARKLLISGVGPGATLATLALDSGIDASRLPAQITLGRDATTTMGNAAETATWANRNGVHSLIVVTAFYHMPRALLELGRALPADILYPAPVMPEFGGNPAVALRLLAGEYSKFLISAAGFAKLAHAPGPA